MNVIKIPAAFYNDYVDRELAAPPVQKRVGFSLWIDRDHPSFIDLVEDAKFYADHDGPTTDWYTRAARRLLKAARV